MWKQSRDAHPVTRWDSKDVGMCSCTTLEGGRGTLEGAPWKEVSTLEGAPWKEGELPDTLIGCDTLAPYHLGVTLEEEGAPWK